MTTTKTNTFHSNISNSSNKRSLDSDHDIDDEEEEEQAWVGLMPDIAEKTSQDANVVQQQQKKQIITKSKLLCFLFLFLFKKILKMY